MVFGKFLEALQIYGDVRKRFETADDAVDRLNRAHTFALIAFLAAAVSLLQYSGFAIDCWCPGHFTQSHVNYVNAICWSNGTYHVAFEHDVPKEALRQAYYQWVPVLLLSRAICCLFPALFWLYSSKSCCLDVHNILQSLRTDHFSQHNNYSCSPFFHEGADLKVSRQLKEAACQIDVYLGSFLNKPPQITIHDHHCNLGNNDCEKDLMTSTKILVLKRFTKRLKSVCYLWCINPFKDKLSVLYLTSKMMYTAISICQFLSLHSLLDGFSFSVFKKFFEDISFSSFQLSRIFEIKLDQRHFPKVTICDFHIRNQVIINDKNARCKLK